MAVPRPAVNSATHSVGFTAKLVTVQSISTDGKSAVCVDRQHTQVTVPMLVQPSKGLLPAVGETWLVTQALGQWTFTAIVASSVSQFQQLSNGSGVFVSNVAPASPASGDLWINPSMDNLMSYWNGTNWIGLQMGAVAIQPGSLTHVQLSNEAAIAASQVNFTASDIGGITVSINATAPANPSAGDLWYDAGNGYVLKQWTGVNWIPYQYGTQAIAARAVTAELIAANTITAAQMAAGIVYAGIIDGTIVNAAIFVGSVFEGVNWLQNGAGQFFYGNTPTTGNLAISMAPRSGNDATWINGGGAGNNYPAGVTVYGPNGSYAQLNSAGLTIQNVYNAGGGLLPTTIISFAPSVSSDIVNVNSTTVGGGSGVLRFNGPIELYGTWTDINTNLLSPLTAALPGSFGASPETWHTMTLTNGWTVGSGGIARYKLNVDNTVSVHCANLLPGTLTSGTAIWSIPTNYVPASTATQNFAATVASATAQGNTPSIAVRGTGTATITIQNLQANVTGLSFMIRYALD